MLDVQTGQLLETVPPSSLSTIVQLNVLPRLFSPSVLTLSSALHERVKDCDSVNKGRITKDLVFLANPQ